MAAEYSHSHGLANLTIGAPGFDSNRCVSINETEFDMHCPSFDTQENCKFRMATNVNDCQCTGFWN
jgi:hypothetical protein